MIQTYRPEHHAIQAAARRMITWLFIGGNWLSAANWATRPFGRLARLVYWEKNERKAKAAATEMAAVLRHHVSGVEAAR